MDVHYKMGAYPLFSSLQATFSLGHIVGIVGANGSGKSTLLRIIAGLCSIQHGSITTSIHSLGFVPATPFLYPMLTVKENLMVVAQLKKIGAQNRLQAIEHALALCSLMEYQSILFNKLSDGLKKRACIASQLVHQPQLLILDEPCAKLDPHQRQQLWELLNTLRQPNRLILFSSHHPQEMSALCDEMYLLQAGKLEAAHKENFAQTLYQKILSSQELSLEPDVSQ